MSEGEGERIRERTVTWDDTTHGLTALPTLSGIEFLRAMMAGEIAPPPISRLLGFTLSGVAPGTATFVCDVDESQYNPIGTVHGGLVCTLLDSALGCAAQTTLPAGMGYTSIEIKVNYLRTVLHDSGPLTAVGTVTKPGRRVAFAEGAVTDAAGRVVATASGSLLIFPVSA